MHALFVFAHQDDEMATATRIAHLLREGATVSCAVLTNGEGRGIVSAVRDEESRRVLTDLGVDLRRVHFLGSETGIPDGQLHQHLDRALQLVEERMREPIDEIYCLGYEGGHHDHDASHLVAVALAARRGLLDRCFEMPLYHGHRLRGPFFNVLAPLRTGGEWQSRKIGFREGLRLALLCRYYHSQRKTWLGLLPEAFLRLALARREWTRRVDPARLLRKPHDGPLFYERRFHVRWEEFASSALPFAAAIPAAPPPSPRESDRR